MKNTIARMIVLGALGTAGAVAAADGITVTPLLAQRTVTCMLEHEGTVYAGLDGGGLAVWPADAPAEAGIWTAGRELSGNYITDLAWSGSNLWVGTNGAGLTRVTGPGGQPTFRQYSGNLSGLDITTLDGAQVGGSERVWYGVLDGGVGVITNGIAGATYTAERDGLISNSVTAIAITADAVWFASAVGISRFAGNTFTTTNTGLTNLNISDLAVAPDGTLTAAGRGGVYTWNEGDAAWTLFGSPGHWVDRLAWWNGDLVAMGPNAQSATVVSVWTGGAFVTASPPYSTARGLAGGPDLWVGGSQRPATMGVASGIAWYARRTASAGWDTWNLDQGPIVANAEGVTFGADGRAWTGSWAGQGFSGVLDGEWVNVFEVASAANDSSGLINQSGNVLAMATGSDGIIWAGQFASGGLLRHDPVSGRTDQVRLNNSGLLSRRIVNLVAHPDGPLLVLHDADNPADLQRAEVLVDPVLWRNPANWISLPTGVGGLGEGPVWDAYVERRDVVWFAVGGTGLVRWDINGDAAGPDDPLTWTDPADDRWSAPVADFPGIENDPKLAKGIDAGPDGSLWVGGDGLVRIFYDATFGRVTVEDFLLVKQSPQVAGLLGGGVYDLATGRDGDLWVACLNGLNRVRLEGDQPVVDAWLDLMNYAGNPAYGILYSPNVIAALPGLVYRKVVTDPGSGRVLLSSDRGTALITPDDGSGGDGGSALDAVYLFPGPWDPGSGDRLAVGGLAATAADPAEVAIYTVEGELVYRDSAVVADAGFWSGVNRVGTPVATGFYVVKVGWHGQTVLRTLAIVR